MSKDTELDWVNNKLAILSILGLVLLEVNDDMGCEDLGLCARYNNNGLSVVNDYSRPGNQSPWLNRVELKDSRLLAPDV